MIIVKKVIIKKEEANRNCTIKTIINFYYPKFNIDNLNQQSIITMINYINMLLKPYNNYIDKNKDENYC